MEWVTKVLEPISREASYRRASLDPVTQRRKGYVAPAEKPSDFARLLAGETVDGTSLPSIRLSIGSAGIRSK